MELGQRHDTLCRLQQHAAALHHQRDRLQQRSEQLAMLNRVLRHDVRNDMNVIQGWIETLSDHVDEEGEPFIDHVRQAAAHVVELTTVAREFVDTVHAEDDPELEPVALADVLTREVARRRRTFEEATIELDEPPPVTVAANELLAAVFRNLVNNAVQHNDTDDPTVTITTEDRGESVVVRIADDGPGIPEEHRADLFGADTKGLDSDGTGMGLYLVERLLDSYGGDIRVEDNTPRGAVFEVELPTMPPDQPTGEAD
ncbi:MAG: HAMP domain-containing sensor histidine kinase [Halobacteriales archaeon]